MATLVTPALVVGADPSVSPAASPTTEQPSPAPDPTAAPDPTTADPSPAPDPTTAPPDPTPAPQPTAAPTTAAPTAAEAPTPVPTAAYQPTGPPTIASDKADYAPGEVVTLTGTNWAAGESVRIVVNDTYGSSWSRDVTVIATDHGVITDSFSLPSWFVSNYDVTATGPSGTATTTFTDLSIGTYDQCSNDTGTGYTSGDTGCRWINGNLQRNNSTYSEGDATVQRLWLTDLTPGSHTVTLQYGTTKGGHHAYDFLTRWDWSEDWLTLADRCQGITGCGSETDKYLAIPVDTNAQGFDALANLVKPRQFTMRGGTPTSATTPAIVSGTYAGDSETSITLTFTVPSSGSMCTTDNKGVTTCGVALWFGAHVALTAQWKSYDGTTGAGGISGSPYHVALSQVDGASVGQRDNQMQSEAVLKNGNIVIVKDAIPNDAQDFSFRVTNGTTITQNFLLDDDSDPTLPNSKTISLPAGTYTASELDIPSAWNLTNLVCSATGANGSSYTTNLGAGTATITLLTGFDTSDTVTCTYTDTKNTKLTVTKTADTSLTRTHSWTINKSPDGEYWKFIGDPATSHEYTVSVDKTTTDSKWAVSGNIVVSNNTSLSAKVTGVSDSISGSITADVTCPVTLPYTLAAGDSFTCTYTASLPDATTRTNTATVTTDNTNYIAGGSATASVDFSTATITTFGSNEVNVTDSNGQSWGPVSADTSWKYTKDFVCPADLASYTDGVYNAPDAVNTATITETGASDTATVKLHCYAPVASKTADASYTRTYTWDITKDYDGTYSLNAGQTVTHDYLVSVTKTTTDSDFVVKGTITVKNPNPQASMTVSLADSVGGTAATLACGGTLTVAAGGTGTCGYTATLGAATNGTNTATATLNSINFTATKDYTFVQNVVGYGTVGVTDTNGQSWTASDTASWSYPKDFTCSSNPSDYTDGTYTITHTNTATITQTGESDDATVTVTCHEQNLVVTKTATPSFTRTFDWTITKTADKPKVYSAGGGVSEPVNFTVAVEKDNGTDSAWTVAGTINVHNPNPFAVTGVTLTDATPGGTCAVIPATIDVPAGDDASASYTCTFASNPGSGTNTATAAWGVIGSSGTAGYTFGAPTNLVNDEIDVTDTNGGSWHFTDSGSQTYQMTYADPAGTCTAHENTATITQLQESATAWVTDCQGTDLTIMKTASPAFTRTWDWTITKAYSDTYNLGAGESVTHHYTVTVDPSSTDSAWTVSGTIHVANPNDWGSITVDVADTVPGGTCTVTGGTGVVLAAGDWVELPYTCTFASQPAYNTDLVNVATVTWDGAAGHTPNSSAVGTATFQFTDPTSEVRPVITVTDDPYGDLGTADRQSATWEYSGNFACTTNPADYTDGSYHYAVPNTATINETGQSADANVDVTCHLAALQVSKTAAGEWDRTVTWSLEKSVVKDSYSGYAGDSFTPTWTVKLTKNDTGQTNFAITGSIYVHNPATIAQTFSLADTLDDETPVTVDCPSYTVAAGETVKCTYTAAPQDASATLNTAVVKATGNADVGATATVGWTENLTGSDSGLLTDPRFTYEQTVSSSQTVDRDETFTCSTNPSDYTNGSYTDSFTNDAYFQSVNTDLEAHASVGITCNLPALTATKDATATYKQDITWDLEKTVSDDSHSGIAGLNAGTSTWTVTATKTIGAPYGWLVEGKIYIHNPAAIAQAFSASDVLDDTTAAAVTCPVPAVVPAGGDVECTYTASPVAGTASLNTATISALGNADITAEATVSYGSIHVGSETAVLADGLYNYSEEISQTTVLTWDQAFSCSSDQSSYTNGSYHYDVTNIATLEYGDTTLSKNASVGVDCILPPLQVSKTAEAQWDRTVTWELAKTVDPTGFTGLAGDSFAPAWTVQLTKHDTGPMNFAIAGEITVTNPSPVDQTFTVADTLNDGTLVAVDCPSSIVGEGSTVVCTYTAAPDDATATLNTATVSATGNADVTATAPVPWHENLTGSDSGNLTDPRFLYDETVSGTTSVGFDEEYTCSTDASRYTNGSYTDSLTNDASFKNTDTNLDADATVGITCHLPALTATKDATATYKQDITWDLEKTVSDDSHSGLAGLNAGTSTWTVTATKTIGAPYGWLVAGKIYIHNPAPIAQAFGVSDVLDDGTVATVTCPDPAVVPAFGSVECTYTASPKDGTATKNTATISFPGNPDVTAEAAVSYGSIHVGSETATLADGLYNYSEEISQTTVLTWDQTFSCSSDQNSYINGSYNYDLTNTATLEYGDETLTRNVTVGVDCTLLPLTARKDATATYKQDITWDLTKTVSDDSHSGFAGQDAGTSTWTVTATKTVHDPYGWLVEGKIYIHNPSTVAQTFSVSDVLDDMTVGAVTCPQYSVPAGGDVECAYTASPSAGTATKNTATIKSAGNPDITADATVSYGSIHVGSETAVLADGLKGYSEEISQTTVLTWDQTFSCSDSQSSYTDGSYGYDVTNTATLKYGSETLTKSATVGVDCTLPPLVPTKTADASYDRTVTWTLTKSATPDSFAGFPGDSFNTKWTVTADKTVVEDNFKISGTISIYNPSAIDQTFTVADTLDDGSPVTVDCPSLTVAAGETVVCTYEAIPDDYSAKLNTATVTATGNADQTTTAEVKFVQHLIGYEGGTLSDERFAYSNPITGDTNVDFNETFTCSTDPSDYTDGKYTETFTNNAYLDGDIDLSASDSVGLTCYWPQIKLTKTGADLSKIGDPVTYTFKLDNATPTAWGMRALSCTISDSLIGFSKTVTLASGASDTSTKTINIPANADDPFINTASVTCSPTSSTFSVSDSSTWSTNLFQPKVEIIKTGPSFGYPGEPITYTFTINNLSSSDSPNLVLDSISDTKIGDLKTAALAADCDNLVYNGSCTFTAQYTATSFGTVTNVVTVHYHPLGFTNDIWDSDNHTVTIVPRTQLTDTSFCPLPNNTFRLVYALDAGGKYRLNASNPGQFYFNAFYTDTPGTDVALKLDVPYPFVTQGAVPIQVHSGVTLTSAGCYVPSPALSGYTISTTGGHLSSSGNSVILLSDYGTGAGVGTTQTRVLVSGPVPDSGLLYVTIHLDYGFKTTTGWTKSTTLTGGYPDATNTDPSATVLGTQPYTFNAANGHPFDIVNPSSINIFKKSVGVAGNLAKLDTQAPVPGVTAGLYSGSKLIASAVTDEDGYYFINYKHTGKAATFTVKVPSLKLSQSIVMKANDFEIVDFATP